MARTAPRRRKPGRTATTKRRSASKEAAEAIDYRNPDSLKQFLNERGRIKSRRMTGLSRRDQSRLARMVKRARELALIPYVSGDGRPPRRGRGRDRD
jgi:small subunit ribosomal protein S18